jgi:hypothetical protein
VGGLATGAVRERDPLVGDVRAPAPGPVDAVEDLLFAVQRV